MSFISSSLECECRKRVVLRTSWIDDHPGRRFHSCLSWKKGGCKSFEWEDPLICWRAKAIIPGILRRVNALEDENKALRQKNMRLLKFAAAMIVFIVGLVLFNSGPTKSKC
ncbi:GRF zinc finger containing protein [Striga asiatica]|uniref:GRF zinc finger containing protein n=1 Tax=Striga asiatica TaxID=4170 RepID=A0A5A7QYQ1_STRAF|nr:GRF zinc finger containing protein [Striga asiatica]